MTQREKFEAAIREQQGKHGMLGDLVRNSDGEYRSACERSAWWAWQQCNPEGVVVMSDAEYEQLAVDSQFLSALRCAGVDNWNGYEEAQEMVEEWDKEDAE